MFDSENRLVATVDPLLESHQLSAMTSPIDPIRTTNPLGFITTSVFDKLLRPVASVDPLLNRTTTTFDVVNRQIRITTPWADQFHGVRRGEQPGRRASIPLANRTSFGYDAAQPANPHRQSLELYQLDSLRCGKQSGLPALIRC